MKRHPEDERRWAVARVEAGDPVTTVAVAPRVPLPKPATGCYHLVRFIQSDRPLDIFGERFLLHRRPNTRLSSPPSMSRSRGCA